MSPALLPETASMRQWTHHQELLVGAFSARCAGGDGSGLAQFLPPDRTTFFAYGRQALAEALRRVGVVAGDAVLVPGFICRDALVSLAALGAVPRFYAVGEDLTTDRNELERAARGRARAVVAVNYFGFPQELGPFQDCCTAHGVQLIEDNAHGFLSSAGNKPLGRRGDLGVLSLRKTLAVPNGAAVIDNRPDPPPSEGSVIYYDSPSSAEWRFRLKAAIKPLIGVVGLPAARMLSVVREIPTAGAARAFPTHAHEVAAEKSMPQEAFSPMTVRLLSRCNVDAERARRRGLYQWCHKTLADVREVRPVFGDLPNGVVPYGYPFLFLGDHRTLITESRRRDLLVQRWPDLPAVVEPGAPAHYRSIRMVSFLW